MIKNNENKLATYEYNIKILAKKFLVKNSSVIGVIITNEKTLTNKKVLPSGTYEVAPNIG